MPCTLDWGRSTPLEPCPLATRRMQYRVRKKLEMVANRRDIKHLTASRLMGPREDSDRGEVYCSERREGGKFGGHATMRPSLCHHLRIDRKNLVSITIVKADRSVLQKLFERCSDESTECFSLLDSILSLLPAGQWPSVRTTDFVHYGNPKVGSVRSFRLLF